MSRQGTPAATTFGGISWVTTEPAPMIAPSPIVTPGNIKAPAPTQVPSQIRIALPSTDAARRDDSPSSCVEVTRATRCPRATSFPIVIDAWVLSSRQSLLIITRSPSLRERPITLTPG